MSNDIGSSLLNQINKSGIDAGNMAKVLAEAEVAGTRSIIDRSEKRILEESSALKYLKANLEAFNSYTKDLASGDLFNQFSTSSSDESVLTASVSGSPLTGSYNFTAEKLARSHTLVTNQGFASKTSPLSEGTLTLQIAGQVHDLTIDASNASLEGLQTLVNEGDYGVTASIINVGGEYKMMFNSNNTGAQNQFTITSDIAGFETAANFSETSTAQDAEITFNGLTISSSTNQFEDLVDGLSLQVKSEAPGVMQTIDVANNSQQVVETVKEFVNVYNQLGDIFKDLSSYDRPSDEEREEDPEAEFTGLLAGSSILRELRTQIRDSVSGAIDGLTGTYDSLASIGISMDLKGVMSLDESVLTNALNSDIDNVSKLFAKGGSSDDSLVQVLSTNDKTQTGSFALELTQVASRASVLGGAATLNGDSTVTIAPGASFSLVLDQSSATTINFAAGDYTMQDLAQLMQTAINNSAEVQASNSRIAVAVEDGKLAFTSERYGGNSKIELTSFSGFDNAGLTTDLTANGVNADGFLTMSDGTQLNIGAYVDQQDGRKFKISDFAFAGENAAEVRGLEFAVMGGDIGARGSINITEGFASRLFQTVNDSIAEDEGLVAQRVGSLDSRLERIEERREKVDARYEKLELKYRLQFSMLQSIMSQMQETQNFLTQTYSNTK